MRCKINLVCCSVKWPFKLVSSAGFQLCKSALPKHRNSRNYLLLTDFSALNAFPCAPKSGSSLLFPSVIWNVITHHFRVLQEPDTYISLSASLSFFPPSLSLSPAVFVCWWRIVYFPPPHIFEHYPYHYLCKWLGLRQTVYRTSSPTPWLNECFYMHTGYRIISLLRLCSGKSVYVHLHIYKSMHAWMSM